MIFLFRHTTSMSRILAVDRGGKGCTDGGAAWGFQKVEGISVEAAGFADPSAALGR